MSRAASVPAESNQARGWEVDGDFFLDWMDFDIQQLINSDSLSLLIFSFLHNMLKKTCCCNVEFGIFLVAHLEDI